MKAGTNYATSITFLREQIMEMARRLRREAGSDEQTWSRLLLLGAIDRYGDEATPTRLAAAEGLRSSNLAKSLKELEERKLITRIEATDDRRKVRVALTPEGKAMLKEVRHRRDHWLSTAIASTLTPKERETLIAAGSLLSRVARAKTPQQP
jgi:DNA-binding MarR family transcriptional regulator